MNTPVAGKVALEEHFATPDTLQDSAGFVPADDWPELKSRLLDIHDRRLFEMDRHGVAMMVLSLNAPAVQAIHVRQQAIDVARRANDFLAEQVQRRPDRFAGFAALPLQDPDAAAAELRRCVRELGFKGALVNGFSQLDTPENTVYLDDARYAGFWVEVEALDTAFYLHPRNPLPGQAPIYSGHPWLLGPTWAFGQETAVHALRLMASGLFDRHPGLKIILGHLGEGLPVSLWRCDHRNAWVTAPKGYPARHGFGDTFRRHFWITTSGNFHTPALINALLELGAERILFSTDWPFENVSHAAEWFDTVALSEGDRLKIGRSNAVSLLKLPL
jgi:gamma-resorcylate decarboxylase